MANYKHKDGCEMSFKFDKDSVYIIANEACDKWCGVHAYGSMTGMYYKQAILIKPSFDCRQATNQIEKFICSNKGLADADVRMAALYKKLKSRLSGEEKDKLKREQTACIVQRDKMCSIPQSIESCIKEMYSQRIDVLEKRIGMP